MRCFLALTIPDAVRSALTVQQFLLPLPRKVPPENFHMTLVFLGDADPQRLEALHDRLDQMRHPAVEVRLNGLGLFGGAKPRSVHARIDPSPALDHLCAKLEQAARMEGFVLEKRRFVPHVTLGRFAPPAPDVALRIERLVAETRFTQAPFEAREVTLFRSHLNDEGAHYDVLADYPLG